MVFSILILLLLTAFNLIFEQIYTIKIFVLVKNYHYLTSLQSDNCATVVIDYPAALTPCSLFSLLVTINDNFVTIYCN